MNKGTAVAELVERFDAGAIICLGDDVTDIDLLIAWLLRVLWTYLNAPSQVATDEESMRKLFHMMLIPAVEDALLVFRGMFRQFTDLTKNTKIIQSALIVFGVIAAKVALGLIISFAPVILPILAISAAILGAIAVVNDLFAMFEGGESVIGDFIDSIWGHGSAGEAVKFLTGAWEDLVKFGRQKVMPWVAALGELLTRSADDARGAWGHFFVAASLGKISLESSVSKQIDLSHEIRAEVDKAIALDPQNGFAYHILGIWNRRLAEIGLMSRLLAQTILWRSVPKGSFEKSEEYLKKALSINPDEINHHLELAKTYVAMGKWNLARRYLRSIEDLPIHYSDDQNHKETARRLLQEIKDR
ncbi:MAG: hypothetical protein IH919_09575 [Deltaproteobacteria bacterium]|nr:hypothetical protein [Deltaproteobacteria bacterium]